ncbi:MAG: LysM domain-containing protein, partial [bacterium]|nr:LysM domain-containing protein [bacterium]
VPENQLMAMNTAGDNAGIHIVQKGETLWKISNESKISVEKLMKANNITDASKLMVGSKIVIPAR